MTPEGSMAPQQSWWSRNWKWVVPAGCLGMLLSCGCLGAIIFGVTFQAIKGSSIYTEAIATASQSPEVREALGEPVTSDGLPQGSVQTSNDTGTARLSIPLRGPKGEGTLVVDAYKRAGAWQYNRLEVDVPGRGPIDLLGNARPSVPEEAVPSPDSLPDVEPIPEDTEPPAEEAAPPSEHDAEPPAGEDVEL
jgi:hypothetical protein